MKSFIIISILALNFVSNHSKAQNVLPKNGYVGIQTSNPKVQLDVRGTSYSNMLILGEYPANTSAVFHLYTNNPAPDSMLLLIENEERKLLQLTSDGVLRSREIIVDADSWPDYVFEDDYSLMSLKEIESFVNENGHLPNIPSAQTIQETGVDVGEMNRLLLEKIEELTLHIIQQQKEIDTLKSILEDH
jgi:hypothetical protein